MKKKKTPRDRQVNYGYISEFSFKIIKCSLTYITYPMQAIYYHDKRVA